MTYDVAVLAGGRGTRLADRTAGLPKPLVPLAGKPLLDHHVELCVRHGFRRILLLVHYHHEMIRAHMGDGARHGATVDYHVEPTARGTGGALTDAMNQFSSTFLVLYGDTYLDVNLRRLWDAHARHRADATLFLHPTDHPHDADLVELNEHGFVTNVHPYPHRPALDVRNIGNAALYVVERSAIEAVVQNHEPTDLATDVFPAMLRAGRRLYGYVSPEYVKDIGTPERLDRVEHDIRTGVPERLSARALRPAVFLDRDGTLNREVGHLSTPDQVELVEGAAGAVRRLNRAGHLAVVITNQAIMARGGVTAEGMDAIHRRLDALLGRGGAFLDRIYMCPHHPDAGFPGEVSALKVACDCRKPRTGSIDAACRDLSIDRTTAWLIGDTTSDIETGRRAGIRTILLRTGHAGQDGKYPFRPDYVVRDVNAAVSWILDGHRVMSRRVAPVAVAALDARLVLVGGLARAGKSSVAQLLKEAARAFGRTGHVLPLDSWLRPHGERSEGMGVTTRFDIGAVVRALKPLIRSTDRHSLELPTYDRARRTMHAHRVHASIGPGDLIIVEGVPALLIDELVELPGIKVHVDMPEPSRMARLRADYQWRGTPDSAVDAMLASRVIDELPAVEGARTRADFIVAAWTES